MDSHKTDDVTEEVESCDLDENVKLVAPQAGPRKYEYVYQNFIIYTYLHVAAFYGLYLCFTSAKWSSVIFGKFRPFCKHL